MCAPGSRFAFKPHIQITPASASMWLITHTQMRTRARNVPITSRSSNVKDSTAQCSILHLKFANTLHVPVTATSRENCTANHLPADTSPTKTQTNHKAQRLSLALFTVHRGRQPPSCEGPDPSFCRHGNGPPNPSPPCLRPSRRRLGFLSLFKNSLPVRTEHCQHTRRRSNTHARTYLNSRQPCSQISQRLLASGFPSPQQQPRLWVCHYS